MTVQRYNIRPAINEPNGDSILFTREVKADNGKWVRYEDYRGMEQRAEDFEAQIVEMSTCTEIEFEKHWRVYPEEDMA